MLFNTVLLLSCEECKDRNQCELPLAGRNYFGAYLQESSVWIYTNQDSSKIDTISISNFQRSKAEDDENCVEWDDVRFTLNSKFISSSAVGVRISNSNECERGMARFNFDDQPAEFNFQDGVSFKMSSNTAGEFSRIDTFQVNNNPELIIAYVYNYENRYWIAPTVGLIQFVTPDQNDTFYVDKFIQL